MSPQLSLTDEEIEQLPAEEVIRWAHAEFGERLCLTCSWQKQSSVLVHMTAELGLEIDFVELDTHLFFRESYETRERLVERYGLTLIRPEIITIAEQHAQEGPNLWEQDPDRCCHIRKVEPLIQALDPYDAWISGIRREQSPSRSETRKVERSERYGVWKVHPSPTGARRRSGGTSFETTSHTTCCTTRATVRSGASRALDRRGPTRKSGPAAGPARTSWNAAYIWKGMHDGQHPPDGGTRVREDRRRWLHPVVHRSLRSRQDDHRPRGRPRARGPRKVVEYLDGDVVRTHLSKGSGSRRPDRDTNIERIGWVASRITRHGGPSSSPRSRPITRPGARRGRWSEEFGPFVEVFIEASVDECARRDVKGLYAKAFAGEIKGFTGVDDPYEIPEDAEIVIHTEEHEPEESAAIILAHLERLGLVESRVNARTRG